MTQLTQSPMVAFMAAMEEQEKENKKLLEAAHTRAQKVEEVVDRQNLLIQELEQKLDDKLAQVQNNQPLEIHLPHHEPIQLNERTHQSFPQVLKLANLHKQVFLFGPAGSGKTTLGHQVATALALPFAHISCSAGMSEGHLLGRMLVDGTYLPTDFVKFYEHGGVFLLDEVDAADANLLLVINSALANGTMSVPNRVSQPTARRHENFVCLLAGNTLGNGSFEYHGRNHLDAAFMDRFVLSKATVDYDVELERSLLGSDKKSAEMLHKLRLNVQMNALRRVISSRVFVQAFQLLSAGDTPQQVLDQLLIGWTEEEKRKALHNVVIPPSSPLKAEAEKRRKEAEKQRQKEAKAQHDPQNSKLKAALAGLPAVDLPSPLAGRQLPDPKVIQRIKRDEPTGTGSIWDDISTQEPKADWLEEKQTDQPVELEAQPEPEPEQIPF